MIDLPLHLVFQFTAQAENKFMPGVRHGARPAVGAVFQRQQERFHPANKLLATQPFENATAE